MKSQNGMRVSESPSSAKAVGAGRLRRDALTASHIVASTLASIAPAMSFFFGFAVIVRGSGIAAPLTILTAMVVILFLTNTIAQFSRLTPSTGSFVTFTGKAFGPSVGTAVSVFITFGYIVASSTVVSIAGTWMAETLKLFLGISIHWAILTVLISAATGWLPANSAGRPKTSMQCEPRLCRAGPLRAWWQPRASRALIYEGEGCLHASSDHADAAPSSGPGILGDWSASFCRAGVLVTDLGCTSAPHWYRSSDENVIITTTLQVTRSLADHAIHKSIR